MLPKFALLGQQVLFIAVLCSAQLCCIAKFAILRHTLFPVPEKNQGRKHDHFLVNGRNCLSHCTTGASPAQQTAVHHMYSCTLMSAGLWNAERLKAQDCTQVGAPLAGFRH